MQHGGNGGGQYQICYRTPPQMEISTQLHECMNSSLILSLYFVYKHKNHMHQLDTRTCTMTLKLYITKVTWLAVLLYLTQTVSYEDKVYGTEPELCDYEKAIYRTTVGREREKKYSVTLASFPGPTPQL